MLIDAVFIVGLSIPIVLLAGLDVNVRDSTFTNGKVKGFSALAPCLGQCVEGVGA